jgi:hypothetical protein
MTGKTSFLANEHGSGLEEQQKPNEVKDAP